MGIEPGLVRRSEQTLPASLSEMIAFILPRAYSDFACHKREIQKII